MQPPAAALPGHNHARSHLAAGVSLGGQLTGATSSAVDTNTTDPRTDGITVDKNHARSHLAAGGDAGWPADWCIIISAGAGEPDARCCRWSDVVA
jgi:hypothetical protein